MRGAVLLVITTLLVGGLFFLTGCGDNDSIDEDQGAQNPPVEPAQPPPQPDKPVPATIPDTPEPAPEPTPPEPAPEPIPPEPEPEPEPMPPEPEPEPEPEPAATDGRIQNQWAKCTVGDWVKYSAMGGTKMILELTKLGDEKLTVKTTMEIPNVPPGTMKPTENEQDVWFEIPKVDGPKPEMETEDLGTETLTIGGKSVECKVTQTKMNIGGKTITSKSWMSDEVPGGMVKSMSDAMGTMSVMQEVLDFKKQ